jgi:hypothetical protein
MRSFSRCEDKAPDDAGHITSVINSLQARRYGERSDRRLLAGTNLDKGMAT